MASETTEAQHLEGTEDDAFHRMLEQLTDLERIAADDDMVVITVSGSSFLARIKEVKSVGIRDLPPHYEITKHPDACGHCWKDPAEGSAKVGQIRYCHGDGPRTCYEITTGSSAF